MLINEIMYHPLVETNREEYIELHNFGTEAIDLAGWRFTSGIRFTFTNSTIIPAGGFLVVAQDTNVFQAKYPNVTNLVGNWEGILSNSGQRIQLVDASGETVDSIRYTDDGTWARREKGAIDYGHRGWEWMTEADGGGKSIELLNPALPNEYGQNWNASAVTNGTPGRANSILTNNIAPLILDAAHFPILPKSTNSVAVTARVLDELKTGLSVVVYHRLDGAASFVAATMLDDGQHGDGAAGDGVYGSILPPQTNDAIVEFYFEARDAAGNSRTFPAPVWIDGVPSQSANLLYQVDDSIYAGMQPLYKLIVTTNELAVLRQINRNSPAAPNQTGDQTRSHAEMNATLISIDSTGTALRYNVAVRNRGNGSRTAQPQSYRVNFLNEQSWKDVQAINLNSQNPHAQLFGSAIYRRSGIPTQQARPVQVRVNNANLASSSAPSYGFYVCNEVLNSEFAARHFRLDSSGNIYRGIRIRNPGADLHYEGEDPAPYRINYFKNSNVSLDDWSDLIELTRVLDKASDADYLAEVQRVLNVEEWMLFFALETIADNRETNLANGNNGSGAGDDYFMYRGTVDRRFQLMPYDLDTIFNEGNTRGNITDGLFRMMTVPVLNRFFRQPEFARVYYRLLRQLLETTVSPPQFNALADQLLTGLVPPANIDNMKSFAAARREFILSQIPMQVTVTNDLAQSNGYYFTVSPIIALRGRAPAIDTHSMLVNGQPAVWSAWEARWTNNAVTLQPGLNRVLVQSIGAHGREVGRATVDVWYDDGSMETVSGTISGAVNWSAANGPYFVASNLTVASGATLTIEPGASVYLGNGVNLTVENGGQLLAEGTATAPIRLTRPPGATTTWGGITINGAVGSPETRIAHAHIEFNSSVAIHSEGGTLFLDHVTFGSTEDQYLSLDDSSFVVSHCVFPTATAAFELVHGSGGIKTGGRGIFIRNLFGVPIGYNDVVDFTGGNRPGPIVQFINNVFLGATDDILDLDGTDAWVEGNIFLHVHRNGSPDSASAVSGGDSGSTTSEITVIGNLFYDCDHAATAKQGNFYTLLNNTIVRQTRQGGVDPEAAVINFNDEGATEGAGMYLEGNIIFDAEQLTRNLVAARVTFTKNLMPFPWSGPGGGNFSGDPKFKYVPRFEETFFTTFDGAQILREWFSLQPSSPARASGLNGADRGGVVPLGATIAGEPSEVTNASTATLTVGSVRSGNGIATAGWPAGSGYTHYQWRLNDGPWSSETPIATPISMTGLEPGLQQVEVVGRRDSGFYQNNFIFGLDALVTKAKPWRVDPNYVPPPLLPSIRINEVLARNVNAVPNGNSFPDIVELHNSGSAAIDLSGMSMSDDRSEPRKFVFPPGTRLDAGGYLVLFADNEFQTPGIHLGFSLKVNGDQVFLFDVPEKGSRLIDSVEFGLQLPDFSVGRLGGGMWSLTQPTLGSRNIAAAMGSIRNLRLNEWLTFASAQDDFIEIFNPEPLPVELSGLYLSDNPAGAPARHEIAPLSFVPALGFVTFLADDREQDGPEHLNFNLAAEEGMIGLLDANLTPIDLIVYGPQRLDHSEGRSPNGHAHITFFPQPTPGGGNPGSLPGEIITTTTWNLLTLTNTWKFDLSGDAGATWMKTNYNDASWPDGAALFYVEDSDLPAPTNTLLKLTNSSGARLITYYFRTPFNFSTNPAGIKLRARTVIDDGMVIYLNGFEAFRLGMPSDTISASTRANRTVDDAELEGPFEIAHTNLVEGQNLLAVEVHQSSSSSSDVAFGLSLDATLTVTNRIIETNLVVLNEVLANNFSITNQAGKTVDWIELFNPTDTETDLSDLSLSNDTATPRQWVFPAGSKIPAHGYLLIYCDNDAPASAINTGFNLNATGAGVFLFDKPVRGGGLLQSVTFGPQAADFSIGRNPNGDAVRAWTLNLPTPGAENLEATLGSTANIRFNEWMANPTSGDDWFELFNPELQPVELSGLFLTDDLNRKLQHEIPPLSFIGVGPNAYLKFIADGNVNKGADHVRFKLSAEGESLGLHHASGYAIDAVSFGQQFANASQGRLPDGTPNIVIFTATPTPGNSNFLPIFNVIINEVLTHTDPPLEDAIELYNPSTVAVNIGGWFLSNSRDQLRKFRIPDHTLIPAGGFKVFYEADFNANPGDPLSFTLNAARGDEVNVSATDANGNLTGYRAFLKFGPAENGVSIGRLATSMGAEYAALSRRTFGMDNPASLEEFRSGKGLPNAGPRMSPVIINEILYHPVTIEGTNVTENPDEEFIELHNPTLNYQPLFDFDHPTNHWRVRDAIDFVFPPDVMMPPGSYLVLVGFNPASNLSALANFRNKYGVSASVPIYGPFSGRLDNSGEPVELLKPDAPQLPPRPDAGLVPYVMQDRVAYLNQLPWPTNANGTGSSLQRIGPREYGNEPANWKAAAPTPGRANAGAPDGDTDGDGMPDAWETQYGFDIRSGNDALLDSDADGLTNLAEFRSGTNPRDAASALRLNSSTGEAGMVQISFEALAGRSYTIQFRPALADGGDWQTLASFPALGSNRTERVADAPLSGRTRFYRLVTPAVP
ncbi:MAG: lamin tail domain-containing protein [Verrucomicrobiota bacterium]